MHLRLAGVAASRLDFSRRRNPSKNLRGLFLCALLLAGRNEANADTGVGPPKLVVLLSVDQARVDYLQRFRPWFTPRGFGRLLSEGRVYRECRFNHGVAKTAPGHATILSGVNADIHGIIANEWIASMEGGAHWINAVQDEQAPLVGLKPAGVDEKSRPESGRSPSNFKATTVGDQLKLRHGSRARVVSIAEKDRSAILLGGKLADSVYWREQGRFVTSTYYRSGLPAWVDAFNRANPAEAYFGRKWERLLEAAAYDGEQGADSAPGETNGITGLSNVFPKIIDGGRAEISANFFSAFDASPFAVSQLLDFVLTAVREEKLGQDDTPDLLCVGVSQTDWNGHLFGPDSHEVMDGFIRLDREVARLLAGLDQMVGSGNYVLVVTADHGVGPLPETVAQHGGVPAGRLDVVAMDAAVQRGLIAAFGTLANGLTWAVRDNSSYRLNPVALTGDKVSREKVARELADIVLGIPGVASVYTRDQLTAVASGEAEMLRLARRSYHAANGADVVYQLAPYFIERSGTGTTHGTPYDYDRHVPLIWFGQDVAPGVVNDEVGVEDIAPTLANMLRIPRPPSALGRPLF